RQILGVANISIHDNFFALGGDSILATQVIFKANQAGLNLAPKDLFLRPTIAELAGAARKQPAPQAEQGLLSGTALFTPTQRWFFAQNVAEPHRYGQAFLFDVRQEIDRALFEQAIQRLLLHHDTLRLRFVEAESGWQQVYSDPEQ